MTQLCDRYNAKKEQGLNDRCYASMITQLIKAQKNSSYLVPPKIEKTLAKFRSGECTPESDIKKVRADICETYPLGCQILWLLDCNSTRFNLKSNFLVNQRINNQKPGTGIASGNVISPNNLVLSDPSAGLSSTGGEIIIISGLVVSTGTQSINLDRSALPAGTFVNSIYPPAQVGSLGKALAVGNLIPSAGSAETDEIVAVGTVTASLGGRDAVFIISGINTLNSTANTVIDLSSLTVPSAIKVMKIYHGGGQEGTYLGDFSKMLVADIVGDTGLDLVVAESASSSFSMFSGRVFIFSNLENCFLQNVLDIDLDATPACLQLIQITPKSSPSSTARSFASSIGVGDIHGTGDLELVIADNLYPLTFPDKGEIYIFTGLKNIPTTSSFATDALPPLVSTITIQSIYGDIEFPFAVHVSDVANDGYAELIFVYTNAALTELGVQVVTGLDSLTPPDTTSYPYSGSVFYARIDAETPPLFGASSISLSSGNVRGGAKNDLFIGDARSSFSFPAGNVYTLSFTDPINPSFIVALPTPSSGVEIVKVTPKSTTITLGSNVGFGIDNSTSPFMVTADYANPGPGLSFLSEVYLVTNFPPLGSSPTFPINMPPSPFGVTTFTPKMHFEQVCSDALSSGHISDLNSVKADIILGDGSGRDFFNSFGEVKIISNLDSAIPNKGVDFSRMDQIPAGLKVIVLYRSAAAFGQFGTEVAAGDVVGDSQIELIISEPQATTPPMPFVDGRIYIVSRLDSILSSQEIDIDAALPADAYRIELIPETGDSFSVGKGTLIVSDVAGDSESDLIFSDVSTITSFGRIYVLIGLKSCSPVPVTISLSSLPPCLQLITIHQKTSGSSSGFGEGVTVGDVMDGPKKDLIIGDRSINYGEVYVLNLESIFTTQTIFLDTLSVPHITITGDPGIAPNFSFFGFGGSPVGDLNNDGINELVIGHPGRHNTEIGPLAAGAAYVIFGLKNFVGTSLSLPEAPPSIKCIRILAQASSPPPNIGALPSSIGIGDFVGDSRTDLVIIDIFTRGAYTLTGISGTTPSPIFLDGPFPSGVNVGITNASLAGGDLERVYLNNVISNIKQDMALCFKGSVNSIFDEQLYILPGDSCEIPT